jgi:hypothetical protein
LNPEIDPAWDDWIAQAMESRRAERFASAAEMLAAMPAAAQRRAGSRDPGRRAPRRGWLKGLLAVGMVLTLAAGIYWIGRGGLPVVAPPPAADRTQPAGRVDSPLETAAAAGRQAQPMETTGPAPLPPVLPDPADGGEHDMRIAPVPDGPEVQTGADAAGVELVAGEHEPQREEVSLEEDLDASPAPSLLQPELPGGALDMDTVHAGAPAPASEPMEPEPEVAEETADPADAERVLEDVRPDGGDPTAQHWEIVNERWVRNYYADAAITMSDRQTGLMWVYDASANGTASWGQAKEHCAQLAYAGHQDWFLPDRDQLQALHSWQACFRNVQSTWYWSSTPYHLHYAWYVNVAFDTVYGTPRNDLYWIWPCREGP